MINCNDVLGSGDAMCRKLSARTGIYTVSPAELAGERSLSYDKMVPLTIEPGSEKALGRFVAVQRKRKRNSTRKHGPVSWLSLKVNGSINTYPDDAVLLKCVHL